MTWGIAFICLAILVICWACKPDYPRKPDLESYSICDYCRESVAPANGSECDCGLDGCPFKDWYGHEQGQAPKS